MENKLCNYSMRNVLIERCLTIPFIICKCCINNCMKLAHSICTIQTLVSNEQIRQVLSKKVFSKNWKLILQQEYRSYSKTPIFINLSFRALCTTTNYILLIYNAFRYWYLKTMISTWNLRDDFCRKMLQSEISEQVFLLVNSHSQ